MRTSKPPSLNMVIAQLIKQHGLPAVRAAIDLHHPGTNLVHGVDYRICKMRKAVDFGTPDTMEGLRMIFVRTPLIVDPKIPEHDAKFTRWMSEISYVPRDDGNLIIAMNLQQARYSRFRAALHQWTDEELPRDLYVGRAGETAMLAQGYEPASLHRLMAQYDIEVRR